MTRISLRLGALGFALALILASTLVAAAAAPASAQTSWEGGPWVGGSFFLSNPPARVAVFQNGGGEALVVRNGEFENAVTFGFNAGVRLRDQFGLGLTLGWTPTTLSATHGLEAQGGTVDVNALTWGLMLTNYVPTFTRVRPFFGFGIGAETALYEPDGWDSRTDFLAKVFAGLDLEVKDGLALRLNARHHITKFQSMVDGEANAARNHLVLGAGVNLIR